MKSVPALAGVQRDGSEAGDDVIRDRLGLEPVVVVQNVKHLTTEIDCISHLFKSKTWTDNPVKQ